MRTEITTFGYFTFACICFAGAVALSGGGLAGVLMVGAAWGVVCAICNVNIC